MTIDLPPAPNPSALADSTVETEPIVVQAAPEIAEPEIAEPEIAEPAIAEQEIVAPAIPELELIDQLWTTYREQLAASIEQQAASVELAEYQKKYDAAVEKTEAKKQATAKLLSSFLERLAAIRDPNTVAMVERIRESVDVTVEAGTMDYEEFRKLSTRCITSRKIEGLGPTKAERLVEQFPTVGHLLDAQTEASKEFVHFGRKLVKGIGDEMADKIAEVMSQILMRKIPADETIKGPAPKKPRSRQVADEDSGSLSEEDARDSFDTDIEYEDEPETGILGDQPPLAVDDTEDDPDSDDWVNPHDDDSTIYQDADDDIDDQPISSDAWAETYLAAIRKDPTQVLSGWGASDKKHSPEWQKGHDAQEAFPVDACPFNEKTDPDKAKEWVRGYCAADALAMDL